jgi:hypothetical protein
VCIHGDIGGNVKVRMMVTPRERELDGVRLDGLQAGLVYEVSPSIGAWLVAQGYAAPEMRRIDPSAQQPYGRKPNRSNPAANRRADD